MGSTKQIPAAISNHIESKEELTSKDNNHRRTQTSNSKEQLPLQHAAAVRTPTPSVLATHQVAGHA